MTWILTISVLTGLAFAAWAEELEWRRLEEEL